MVDEREGVVIETEEEILHLREVFIKENEEQVYNHAVTLCHMHHRKLHNIYGKRPKLITAKKQENWVEIQRKNMAWYDFILGRSEKENPAQYVIARDEGLTIDTRENVLNYRNAYETLEIVNRAVNMIVDDAAEVPFDVGEKIQGTVPIKKIYEEQE